MKVAKVLLPSPEARLPRHRARTALHQRRRSGSRTAARCAKLADVFGAPEAVAAAVHDVRAVTDAKVDWEKGRIEKEAWRWSGEGGHGHLL